MKHLKNLLLGFSNIFSGFQPAAYAPVSNGFETDAHLLTGDVKTVGRSLKKHTRLVYGKTTSHKSTKYQRR